MSFQIFGCSDFPPAKDKEYARSLLAEAAIIDFAKAARAAEKVQKDTDCLRVVEESYNQLGNFILRMPLVRGPQTPTDIIIPRSDLLGFPGLQDEKKPETFQERIAHSDESAEADLRPRKITFIDPALLPIHAPVIPRELLEDAFESYELINNIVKKRNQFRDSARNNPQIFMEQFRLVAYAAARRAAFKKHLDVMQKIVAIDLKNIRLVHKNLSDDVLCAVLIRVVDNNGACAEIHLGDYRLEGGRIKNPKLYTMPGLRYWSNPLANQASAARGGAGSSAGSSADQAEDSDKRCTLQ